MYHVLSILKEPVAYNDGVITQYINGCIVDYRVTLASLNIDAVSQLICVTLALESMRATICWKRVYLLLVSAAMVVMGHAFVNYAIHIELINNQTLLRDITYHPAVKCIFIALIWWLTEVVAKDPF